MTQLVEQMIQKIRSLSKFEQNQIAESVIQQINDIPKNKTSNNYVSKLSDDLLMPILDVEDDLFVRDIDTGRENRQIAKLANGANDIVFPSANL